jgi:hypothetical protein
MSRLNVHVYDHTPFMSEVACLLEDILGRPVYEIEDWRRLVTEARKELKLMRSTCSLVQSDTTNLPQGGPMKYL